MNGSGDLNCIPTVELTDVENLRDVDQPEHSHSASPVSTHGRTGDGEPFIQRSMSKIKLSDHTVATSVTGDEKESEESTLEEITEDDLNSHVQDYLKPLKMKLRQQRNLDDSSPSYNMPWKLLKSLCHYIWEVNMLDMDKCVASRIYGQLDERFHVGENQSDLDDCLEFKPVELISSKCMQIFVKLILGDIKDTLKELESLNNFLLDRRITRDNENDLGFKFLAKTLELTVNVLADIKSPDESEIPDFENLGSKSQCVVKAARVYFARSFRIKPGKRMDLMQKVVEEDKTNVEWLITVAEMHRRKRRESATAKARRASNEESQILADARSMAKDNPFVTLCLIDFIIDHLRDSRGRFHCGDLELVTQEDTMRFLQDICRELVEEYPNNVQFNSQISDYFLRYVPYLYFNIPFSGELLQRAYELNPENPKTTHRLGIYHRMSLHDIEESFKWFIKTTELDPTHVNACMEFFKTALGKFDEYDTATLMREKLSKPEVLSWSELELQEFDFLMGLAYFAKGDKEETLKIWEKVVAKNQIIFRIPDLDRTCGFYNWDPQRLSSDKLRLWMKAEQDAIKSKEKAGEEVNEQRKVLVGRLYSLMLGGGRPNKMEASPGPFGPNHRRFDDRFQNMIFHLSF